MNDIGEGNVFVDRKLADLVFNVERVDCTAVLELVGFAADKYRH